jgi:DNA-binding PadR family transcriptional regulator
MPRASVPNPLHHALLGLVSRRPLSGYEILKRFSRSIVFFWSAQRSQIYAELKRMERLGLLTSRLAVQGGRPTKRAYAITPAGRAVLRTWLDRPTPLPPIKDPLLLRTFFADLLPPERAAEYLRDHGEAHARLAGEFEEISRQLERRHGPLAATDDRALFFGWLVLEHGIRYERMYADWCRWAAGEVKRRGRPRGVAPSPADFVITS